MKAPLRVYLDSQDFSRMSPSHPDYKSTLAIKQELLKLSRLGVAQFLFSDIHVFECLPTDPLKSGEGLERMRTIVELCGKNNLPASTSLMVHELRKLSAQDESYRKLGRIELSTDWFPEFEMPLTEAIDWRAICRKQLSETNLPRNQRRALEKKVMASRTSIAKQDLVDAGLQSFLQKFPFRPQDVDSLVDYVKGKKGRETLGQLVKNGLDDLILFSEWLVANWETGQPLVSNLRAVGKGFSRNLEDFYDKMQALFNESTLPDQLVESNVNRVMKEQYGKLFADQGRRLANRLLNVTLSESDPRFFVSQDVTPCLYAAYTFMFGLLKKSSSIDRARNPHKKKESDFADGMHIFFMPRVDLFRADKFSSSLIRDLKIFPSVRVVDSLKCLPDEINKMATL